MVQQDLSVSLSGKDISASQAFYALARAAKSAAQQAEDSLGSMNRKVESSSQNSLRSVTGSFGSGLASWAQSGLAGILGGITASVTSSVMNVVGDAGQAILGQLKSSVIDYNSTLEQAGIGFTTMLGSGQKASAFLKQLQDFGLKTPFQTDQLIQLAQQMMGYGIASKDVIPQLTALGDAAAASGKTGGDGLNNIVLAFEQMHARGRVDLGDINQLTSGGVPALKILAAQYGVSTGQILKMIGTGKLMASDALPKLISGIEKGTKSTAALGGMMEKQSGTFQGAMSNISDSLNRALGTAFQPVFKIVEKLAIGIEKFTTSKSFTKWANDTGKAVGKAMGLIGGALKDVFGDPKVQKQIGKLGDSLSDAFKAIGPAMQSILPDLVKFGKEVMPTIIDVMKAVVDKIPTLLKWWARLAGGLADAGPTIAGVIGFLSDFSGALFDLSAKIGNFVADAVRNFQKVGPSILAAISSLPGQLMEAGGQVVQGFINGITGNWGGVMANVTALVNQIPVAVRKMLGIASPSKVFAQIGAYVGQGLSKGLLGSTDQIKSASAKMADAITSQFKSGNISKATEKYALAANTATMKTLTKLADQRAALQNKLAGLKSDRTGVHDDVKASTIGAGDITAYAAPGDAVQGLAALVQKTKTFTSDLKSLVRKGVSGSLLSQLVDGWQSDPDTALNTAQGLLANPGDLKQILALQKQLSSAGAALGSYAGHAEYDSQIGATSGKIKVDTWKMQKAAQQGLKKAANEVHIHLPANGIYVGTKEQIAKSVQQIIHDGIKKGYIPKNWSTG